MMDARDLHQDGVLLLAAKLIEQCVAEAQSNPEVLVVAVQWATWCGVDPLVAAKGIAERVRENDAPPLRVIDCDDHEEQHRVIAYDWHYSDGKRCPLCGTPITNTSRVCVRHKWFR